jgi:hypothetical protein
MTFFSNILFCYFKNAYRFKKHFFNTKYIFLCTIALKNDVYKDLLTSPSKVSSFAKFKSVYKQVKTH